MNRASFIASVAVITVVTLIRVASADRTNAQVIDEPVHIAAGHDYLATGRYASDIEHPPLARVLAALPLWIEHREPAAPAWKGGGNELLLRDGRYVHNLALARAGNLVFLATAMVTTALWGAWIGGYVTGAMAALFLALLPPILGHAGVATTDLAAGAMVPLALYALMRWLDAPWPGRAAFLGVAVGLGVLSKFSFLIFFPAGALVVLIFHRRRVPLAQIATALIIAAAIVFVGYGFHVSAFVRGLIAVQQHNVRGHTAYLFGETSATGWWYYFPIAVAVKTPLPVLALAFASLFTRRREAAIVALAILAASMPASINIGVRHVLPLYVPLAIGAAAIFAERRAASRAVVGAAVLWTLINSMTAYPDAIAWFNELAGEHPERILVDSNLDWGQDILRMRRTIRDQHIAELNAQLFTSADLAALGFPTIHDIDPASPSHGWVAISETPYQIAGGDRGQAFRWLHGQPYRRIGKSIRLYYLGSTGLAGLRVYPLTR